MSKNPQDAFDALDEIQDMLSLPVSRERATIKARQGQAARLIEKLMQSIPPQVSQLRARGEVPILASKLKRYLNPVTHKKHPGGSFALSSDVGLSLRRITSVLGEEYPRNPTP